MWINANKLPLGLLALFFVSATSKKVQVVNEEDASKNRNLGSYYNGYWNYPGYNYGYNNYYWNNNGGMYDYGWKDSWKDSWNDGWKEPPMADNWKDDWKYDGWKYDYGWKDGWKDGWKPPPPPTPAPPTCDFTEDDGEDNFFFVTGTELTIDCETSHVTEYTLKMAFLSYFNADINCECPGNHIKYTDVIITGFETTCDEPSRREMRSEEAVETNPMQRKLAFGTLNSSQDTRGQCGAECPSNPFPGASGFRRLMDSESKKGSKSDKEAGSRPRSRSRSRSWSTPSKASGKKGYEETEPECGEALLISIFAQYGIDVESVDNVNYDKVPPCETAFACDEKECCGDLPFNACPDPKDECHCDFVKSGYGYQCTKSSCVKRLDLSAAPPQNEDWW